MEILVTGSAGFIGSALTISLLELGYNVTGIDNHNDNLYNPRLKDDRLQRHLNHTHYEHVRGDITDSKLIKDIFKNKSFDAVINLAAEAGVRNSIEHPKRYLGSNIDGFLNILEACKVYKIKHLVYASSSSVYGLNANLPYSTQESTGHPVSLYAATKRTNELMAHTYSHLFGLKTTGLRFFTVYGPWDRPDMALQKFTGSILSGESIKLFNKGNHGRDFTYIEDIVNGIIKVLTTKIKYNNIKKNEKMREDVSSAPWKIYNIGNGRLVSLNHIINSLEGLLKIKAKKNLLPLQPGDVVNTHADIKNFMLDFDYSPKTNIDDGLHNFVEWYRSYYNK